MVLQTVKMGDTAGAAETAADQIQWSIPQKARECREWLRFLRLMADFRPIFVFFSGALRCGSSNEFAMKLNFECQSGREMSPPPEYSRIFWSRCSGIAPAKCQFSGQFNDGNNAFHSIYSPIYCQNAALLKCVSSSSTTLNDMYESEWRVKGNTT